MKDKEYKEWIVSNDQTQEHKDIAYCTKEGKDRGKVLGRREDMLERESIVSQTD